METSKISLPKGRYSHITTAKRLKLLQMVLLKSYSISGAARHLSIALSTAKQIIKKYKTTGIFFIAKKERTSYRPSFSLQDAMPSSEQSSDSVEEQENQNEQFGPVLENMMAQVAFFYVLHSDFGWCYTGQAVLLPTGGNNL